MRFLPSSRGSRNLGSHIAFLPVLHCPVGCWLRRERVPALLARLRLSHGAVTVHSTPRRLAVAVAASGHAAA